MTDAYPTSPFVSPQDEAPAVPVHDVGAEIASEDERLDPGPIEADLAEVDAALARLDAGAYGTCEVCNDGLEDAVLAADPLARFCAGHLPGTVS